MHILDYPKRLLSIAETVNRWAGALSVLDRSRRVKVARYAEAIAETLGRAACHGARLTSRPHDKVAQRGLVRELGRISGYLETLVAVLQHHLDGRKLAGVKRRLEPFALHKAIAGSRAPAVKLQVDRLLAAEGYFRALADALRV